MDQIVEWAKELQSLAQAGLYYGHDIFDHERYQRVREIAAEMMLMRSDVPVEKITGLFCGDEGYQTPKVDTRAAIFRDGKILLVCEKGEWSMPGGWCEFNLSPAENAIKETKEEAGLDGWAGGHFFCFPAFLHSQKVRTLETKEVLLLLAS